MRALARLRLKSTYARCIQTAAALKVLHRSASTLHFASSCHRVRREVRQAHACSCARTRGPQLLALTNLASLSSMSKARCAMSLGTAFFCTITQHQSLFGASCEIRTATAFHAELSAQIGSVASTCKVAFSHVRPSFMRPGSSIGRLLHPECSGTVRPRSGVRDLHCQATKRELITISALLGATLSSSYPARAALVRYPAQELNNKYILVRTLSCTAASDCTAWRRSSMIGTCAASVMHHQRWLRGQFGVDQAHHSYPVHCARCMRSLQIRSGVMLNDARACAHRGTQCLP